LTLVETDTIGPQHFLHIVRRTAWMHGNYEDFRHGMAL
jgi:hypothetical protein